MSSFVSFFTRHRSSDRGASMVEYGLLIALIVIVGMAALGSVGSSTGESFEVVAAGFEPGGQVDPGHVDSNDPSDPGQDPSDNTADDESNDSRGTGGADGGEIEQGGVDDADEPAVPSDPPNDNEDASEPGADEQTGDDDDQGSDTGNENGGDDDEGGQGGNGGTGGDNESEPEEPVTPGSTVSQTSTGADYYWWNQTKNGGEGAWKASVAYENTWIRHQYLTLEITRVDEKGKTTVTTVKDFYVPANGKSTFELWDNALSVNRDKVKGTVSVSIEVKGIRTSDESWKTVSFPGDGTISVVEAPKVP